MNNPQRRADDPRINKLVLDMDSLKTQVDDNSKIVKEVHGILTSFHLLAKIAKWITIMGSAIAFIYTTINGAIAFFTSK